MNEREPSSEEIRFMHEHDRRMDERIEELRRKHHRREKLTEKEWELLAFGSQPCHCGQRMVG